LIEVVGITKRYGINLALDGLTFNVPSGAACGLLGPNGAGKTTTLRILSGLLLPDDGFARINGLDVAEQASSIMEFTGYMPEHTHLPLRLTPAKFLENVGKMYDNISEDELYRRIEENLRALCLWERRKTPIGTLSHGMKRKLLLIRSFIHNPSILLLDEPMLGIDPEAYDSFERIMLNMHRRGVTILLSTHRLFEVERLCNSVSVIYRGRCLFSGKIEELIQMVGLRRKITITLKEMIKPVERILRGETTEYELEGNNTVCISADTIDVSNLLRRLIEAGAEILRVEEERQSLKNLYLELVKRAK